MDTLMPWEQWLQTVQHWHWWILAVTLIILEVTLPAFFFLWMGVAAGVVGLLLYVIPGLTWESQVLWFSLLSVVAIGVWHLVLKRQPTATDLPTLNRRGSGLVGRTFTLCDPMVNGAGKIRADDTLWMVRGEEDAPAGRRVTVEGLDGTTLLVRLLPEP